MKVFEYKLLVNIMNEQEFKYMLRNQNLWSTEYLNQEKLKKQVKSKKWGTLYIN